MSERKLRIMVLMGGTSSEREISLSSGRMIVDALNRSKYEVSAMDARDMLTAQRELTSLYPPALETGLSTSGGKLTPSSHNESPVIRAGTDGEGRGLSINELAAMSMKPDVVFIALHGKGGEDGTIQGMLELMKIPYTGSGVLASALAMDKVMSKRVFKAAGIPVIESVEVKRLGGGGWTDASFRQILLQVEDQIGFPVFVKPNAGGSTCGCTLVTEPEALAAAVNEAHRHDDLALIERYIKGTEITVGILDTSGLLETLPVIEIVPKNEFYDYESKYAEGGSEHIIPARISEKHTKQAQDLARRCHAVLGCRGATRTDLILNNEDMFVLEVNTIPGMTPTSLLPQAAASVGITFSELLDRFVDSALQDSVS